MATSAADGTFVEEGARVIGKGPRHIAATDGDMHDLAGRIDEARRRASLNGLLRAGLIAIVTGLTAFSLMRLGSILFDMPQSISATAAYSASMAMLLLAGGVVFLLLRPPDARTLARKADRQFGLQERISTALSVDFSRTNVVERALIADAGKRASHVEPDRLVPFQLGGLLAIAVALTLCAFALAQVNANGVLSSADPAALSTSRALSAQEADEIGDELRRVAALVQADADRQAAPYLEATARSLTQLAENVATGEASDRTMVADRIDQLRDHAVAAYQLVQGDTVAPGANRREVEESLRNIATDARAAAAADASPADPADALPAVNREDGALGGLQPDAGETALNDTPAAPVTAAEPIIADREPVTMDPALMVQEDICNAEYEICETENVQIAAEAGGPQRAIDQTGATPNAVQRAETPGGMLLGPANEADRGDAALAGQGTRPLGEEDGETADGFAAAEDMLLPDRGEGNGNYVTLNAPAPVGVGGTIEGTPGVGLGWQAIPEREIGRALLATAQRDIVARYFRALAETAE